MPLIETRKGGPEDTTICHQTLRLFFMKNITHLTFLLLAIQPKNPSSKTEATRIYPLLMSPIHCVASSPVPLLSTLTVSRGNLGKREKMNTKTEQKHQGKEKKESEEETREEERRREQRSDEEEREDKTSKEKKRGRERRRGGKRREEEERRGERRRE